MQSGRLPVKARQTALRIFNTRNGAFRQRAIRLQIAPLNVISELLRTGVRHLELWMVHELLHFFGATSQQRTRLPRPARLKPARLELALGWACRLNGRLQILARVQSTGFCGRWNLWLEYALSAW